MLRKRLFDLAASICGIVIFAPLFAIVALAIKLDSPGPAFFRQERIGRGEVPFRIHKFRTMSDARRGEGAQITVGADPRITRVGGWLRKLKIDELPQLLDVIVGRMSLVGPRPEVPRYVAYYPPEYRTRVFAVRPGMTDYASIKFRNESEILQRSADPEKTYIEEIIVQKLRLNMEYLEDMGLMRDISIIFRTMLSILDAGGR